MNNPLTSYCLKQMGIETWHSRYPLLGASQKLDCQRYRLRRYQSNEVVATLLLQVMATTPLQQQKIHSLLDNMMFAIGLEAQIGAERIQQPEGVLVIWGLPLAQKILQNELPLDQLQQNTSGAVVSYHPLELLQQPQLKAKAWQDLRLLSQLIASGL